MVQKCLKIGSLCLVCLLTGSPSARAQERKMVEGKPFVFMPRPAPPPVNNGGHPPYRNLDGTNNNIAPGRFEWGATDIPLLRELPVEYGNSDPKNAMGGTHRPSARQLSNVLCDEPTTIFSGRNLSTFIYVWGQFLDHDITLTPTGSTEYAPVPLPADEPLFTVPVPFFRSEVRTGTGVNNPRQQSNLNTAWVDASVVYGSDATRANWLRTFKNGKLKTSAGNLLPWNTTTGEQTAPIDSTAPSMVNDADHTVKTFVAGDVRAGEHPGITGLHTLFVREHNRICDRLLAQGLRNDEEIYQRARKEVGALIQAITYQEFLPIMGVTLSPYNGYRDNVQPDLLNTFATAAYRIGHTMVADEIAMRDNNCNKVGSGVLELDEVFFDPQFIATYGLEPFLKGFAGHKMYETNTKINSVLRNFLFGSPSAPVRFGLDLASLNIQRGRDHGLPNYNAIRAFYTGNPIRDFNQITTNTTLAMALKNLYGNVNNIDLWIGLLAEDLLPGKSVGPTMHAMLKTQFERLRDGDFYFFRNDPALPQNIRDQVSNTKLSDVIKRNTSLTNLPDNVFLTTPCPGENGEAARVATEVATSELKLNLYPNPTQQVLTIEVDTHPTTRLLRIVGLDGSLMKQLEVAAGTTQLSVPVGELRAGLYLVKLSSATTIKTVRFIKAGH